MGISDSLACFWDPFPPISCLIQSWYDGLFVPGTLCCVLLIFLGGLLFSEGKWTRSSESEEEGEEWADWEEKRERRLWSESIV